MRSAAGCAALRSRCRGSPTISAPRSRARPSPPRSFVSWTWRVTAWSWSTRTCRWRTCSTTGPRLLLERSVRATAAGWASDRAAYEGLMEPRGACLGADGVHPGAGHEAAAPPGAGGAFRAVRDPVRDGAGAGALPRGAGAGVAGGPGGARHGAAGAAATASFGLVLAVVAHAAGWPVVRGGTANLAAALAAELRSLGGEIVTGHRVASLAELPAGACRAVRHVAAGHGGDRRRSHPRSLWPPAPWLPLRTGRGQGGLGARWPDPLARGRRRRAGTVHVGGSMAEVAAAESAVGRGGHADRPFLLVVQASLFDPTRAPEGKHTGWAYCHVPNGAAWT